MTTENQGLEWSTEGECCTVDPTLYATHDIRNTPLDSTFRIPDAFYMQPPVIRKLLMFWDFPLTNLGVAYNGGWKNVLKSSSIIAESASFSL